MSEKISGTMKALTLVSPGHIELTEKPIPQSSFGEALLRITATTICGTDVHILKGEYPIKSGLTIGHEPVGVIAALGSGVKSATLDLTVSSAGQILSARGEP